MIISIVKPLILISTFQLYIIIVLYDFMYFTNRHCLNYHLTTELRHYSGHIRTFQFREYRDEYIYFIQKYSAITIIPVLSFKNEFKNSIFNFCILFKKCSVMNDDTYSFLKQ